MGHSDTKRRIIEKATDLFYQHGFVKASIRDIVRAVGVTNSTAYIHFKNKDGILYAIIEEIGEALLQALSDPIKSRNDPVECLRAMIFTQVCLINEKRKEIKIYLEEQYQLPPVLRKKALKQHRQIYDLYFHKICELNDKGLLRGVDSTVATFGIFAMMNWAYRWFRTGGRLPIETVADHIISVFFSGIFREGVLPGETIQSMKQGEAPNGSPGA